MNILRYPHSSLLSPCTTISDFSSIPALVTEMTTTMLTNGGIGLAANQVGHNIRLFILKDKNNTIHTFANPRIISTDGLILMEEGCLSAPGIRLNIQRPETLVIEYQDENGEKKSSVATGLDARIIQHEIEHLLGDFYFNRVNRAIRKRAIAILRKT